MKNPFLKILLLVLALSFVISVRAKAEEASEIFLCKYRKSALVAAQAFHDFQMLNPKGFSIAMALKKKKLCWFENASIPKGYVPFRRFFIAEHAGQAWTVIRMRVKGSIVYAIIYEVDIEYKDS